MLQADDPVDYVIGTGVQHSVRTCYELAFRHLDLDPTDFVRVDKSLQRPAEVDTLLAARRQGHGIIPSGLELSGQPRDLR